MSGVVINEVLTNPKGVSWDINVSPPVPDQWLELFNTTSESVNLGLWQITTADQSSQRRLSREMNIAARSYLVLYRADLSLNLADSPITLLDPNNNVVDSVSPPALPADQSYARIPDGSSNWVIDPTPTLGSANVVLALASGTPDTQATIYAIQTVLAAPLPSPPALPDLPNIDDGSPDAADVAAHRTPRAKKGQSYQTLPISAVRQLPDDSPVITTGVVTMPSGLWDASRGYIQADGAGILMHTYGNAELHLGDNLTIKGRVHHFNGEVEVAAVKGGEQVATGGALPEAEAVTPEDIGPNTEALLVRLTGQVAAIEREYVTVVNESSGARVFLYRKLNYAPNSFSGGQTVSVTGVVNADPTTPDASVKLGERRRLSTGHRLLPRGLADLVIGGLGVSEAGGSDRGRDRSGKSGGSAGGDLGGSEASGGRPGVEATAFVTPVLSGRQTSGLNGSGVEGKGLGSLLMLGEAPAGGLPVWAWIAGAAGGGLVLGGGIGAGVWWRLSHAAGVAAGQPGDGASEEPAEPETDEPNDGIPEGGS